MAEGQPDSSSYVRKTRDYLYGHAIIRETLLDPTGANRATNICYGIDGHGNVRFLTDDSGNITDTYTFDAFGIPIAQTHPSGGATPNNYLYCGEQYDPDLGLYYNRNRYLNVREGRFWTMDTHQGSQQDPPSLHKYLYAADSPVDMVDPLGLWSLTEAIYGRRVHREIGYHFEFWGIDALSDKSINQILNMPKNIPVWGALRPDLVERGTSPSQVYEIKPAGSFVSGRAKLQLYLICLNAFDPVKRKWVAGQTYIPPSMVPCGYAAIALVSPPVNGVILYEVLDMKVIIAAVAVVVYYDLRVTLASVTLRTVAFGF
jgi:RHS repeat-associated protein